MSSNKHADTVGDLNIPYEGNDIQLKGIVGFGIGLFLLIVITFGLMWAFRNVLSDYHHDSAEPANPMAMTEKDKLPPEPRLQLAPGFGVDTDHGRVNLELGQPSDEYQEMKKQWTALWEHGQKDAKTGAITMMPIDEAKEKLLEENVKAKSGADAEEFYVRSHEFVSDSSAGRVSSETRR